MAVLLRGINVGGHKKVPMAALRALLESLGHRNVRTHLQSGNAVLSTPDPPADVETALEAALADRFGFEVRVLARTRAELCAVLDRNPLREVTEDGARMLAVFLSTAPDPATAAEHDVAALDPDRIRVGDRVVYQWCPDGVSRHPDVSAFVARHWRVVPTGRNWNTVQALDRMLGELPG